MKRHFQDSGGLIRGSLPELLTREQEALARQLWEAGEPVHEVARQIGTTYSVFRSRLADQLSDLPRRRQGTGGGPRVQTDPGPEEIAEIAAQIRQGWTDLERDERRIGPSR